MTDTVRDAEIEGLRLELQMLKVEREAQGDEIIAIGSYLLARLEQLGVTVRPTLVHSFTEHLSTLVTQKMFGVPGDFNLGFLVSRRSKGVATSYDVSSVRTWSGTTPPLTGSATGS